MQFFFLCFLFINLINILSKKLNINFTNKVVRLYPMDLYFDVSWSIWLKNINGWIVIHSYYEMDGFIPIH